MKSNHIVFTTIYKAEVLLELTANLERNGRLDDTVCWVVGDLGTPEECKTSCLTAERHGLETKFLSIEYQDTWGKKFPEFYNLIPYKNETRRNIGFLHALEAGCKTLISIDDDNFPSSDDFIGFHAITGTTWQEEILRDASGYFNVCELLDIFPKRPIFPRGFPFNKRGRGNSALPIKPHKRIVIGANSGLWLNEPDIDATTWLNGPVKSNNYLGPPHIVLDQETWSPINTQNTSLMRELIPAYLCIPMGHAVPGGNIERYGDIWSGYFMQAIMNGTPYHICFGRPIVEHRRNPHNYLNDLRHEYWGMMLTDWLLEELRQHFEPVGSDIIDRVIHLAAFIEMLSADRMPAWSPPEVCAFMRNTSQTLYQWALVCRSITG